MLRIHHRRAGLSLMEALVALFIMAIGMISLLTLFPLGAIQMGRALRDDRCAQCAWQADGTVRVWWQTEVVDKPGAENGPYWNVLDAGIANPTTTTTPSKVVAIDPIGLQSGRTGVNLGGAGGSIPRRTSSTLALTLPAAMRACSLMDDIYFNELGQPDTVSGSVAGKVVRQGRYNWMALIQRPVNKDRYVANLKILVFDGRPAGPNPPGIEQLLTVTATVGSPQITVAAQGLFPTGVSDTNFPLGKGGWLLDGTGGTRMDFYRIQSITPNGTTAIIELDTPIKNATTQLIALRGLAEVFDRPVLAPTGGANAPVP